MSDAERSIVTILAADIVGSTKHILASDPDEVEAFFDRCFDDFTASIEAYEGGLLSYEGDGGIAVFGWPIAVEDHADRACAAAWRLQHLVKRPLGPSGKPVTLRVGVHSGLVSLRQLQKRGRSGWDIAGAAVNIAAKLQQAAAPGTIAVSATTAALCRSELLLSPLAGRSSSPSQSSFRLQAAPDFKSRRAAGRYSTPFVGREAEREALRGHLLVGARRAAATCIIGEAGIGKSRLAHAISTEAVELGWNALAFFGDAQIRASPFASVLAIAAELLGIPDGSPVGELQAAFQHQGLGSDADLALSQLFGRRSGQGTPASEVQIARALAQMLSALLNGRPTLILVEDLHLIDAGSQLVLRLLRELRSPELALLLTSRREGTEAAREIGGVALELEGLGNRDLRTIALELCPTGTPEDIVDRIIDRSDGIVFVLEELARSVGADPLGADIPTSVESSIHARLGRLPPGAKELAQALSLLGEQVEIDLLGAVAEVEPLELSTQLAVLERFSFTYPSTSERVRFRHHVIAEACANTIPRERRRKLHRTALDALDARPREIGGRLRLALHAEGAGEDDRALAYLWEAALESRGSSSAATLNLVFDHALAVIERSGERTDKTYVDFVLMAFPSMLLLGEFAKMRVHLPRVMERARAQQRMDKVSNCLSQLGMLCWFEGRYQEGLAATLEGRRLARRLNLTPLVYSNQLMMANVLHGAGHIDHALTELEDLAKILDSDGSAKGWGAPAIPLSTTFSFIGWIKTDTDHLEEALEYGHRGLEIARREGDPYSEIMARNAVGRALLQLGRDQEAILCLEVAWDMAETHGYDATKANLAGHLASALTRCGRAPDAISIIETCLRARLQFRTGQMENFLLKAGYAEALSGIGDQVRGLAELDEALEIARAVGNPTLLAAGLKLRKTIEALGDSGDFPVASGNRPGHLPL